MPKVRFTQRYTLDDVKIWEVGEEINLTKAQADRAIELKCAVLVVEAEPEAPSIDPNVPLDEPDETPEQEQETAPAQDAEEDAKEE